MVRKDNAKRILEKYFTENIDYKVETITPPIGGAGIKKLGGSGLNKEKNSNMISTVFSTSWWKTLSGLKKYMVIL